jgi:hypothetical protein
MQSLSTRRFTLKQNILNAFNILFRLQAVFHSVLSSRLLFNLRAIIQRRHEQTIVSVMEMDFQSGCHIPLRPTHTIHLTPAS